MVFPIKLSRITKQMKYFLLSSSPRKVAEDELNDSDDESKRNRLVRYTFIFQSKSVNSFTI